MSLIHSVKSIHEFTWEVIGKYVSNLNWLKEWDAVNGPANSQALLRLFGRKENEVRVTLYRDHHAWCPYCQKVWLFLEEKNVPYRIRKVTMFCYGDKELWYKQICPSGMLPALELDGKLITQSDDILIALENTFGSLRNHSMIDNDVIALRKLERLLFSAWCRWLCYPGSEKHGKSNFEKIVQLVESHLCKHGPFMLGNIFTIADIVFIPYVERMNASLFYYKGFKLRDPDMFPFLSKWFDAIESVESYKGTQSDFHTHCHDLPPQMGGCYRSGFEEQTRAELAVDSCVDFSFPETGIREPENSREFALSRVLKFHDYIMKVNPVSDKSVVDECLRHAMYYMMTGRHLEGKLRHKKGDVALRYIRDRINVPRDMPIWSARRLREALEATASLCGSGQSHPISEENRRDQNPKSFGKL